MNKNLCKILSQIVAQTFRKNVLKQQVDTQCWRIMLDTILKVKHTNVRQIYCCVNLVYILGCDSLSISCKDVNFFNGGNNNTNQPH